MSTSKRRASVTRKEICGRSYTITKNGTATSIKQDGRKPVNSIFINGRTTEIVREVTKNPKESTDRKYIKRS